MLTISEYLSYLAQETMRARLSADAEAVRIAKVYAQDPIMKHFPVPRFKMPELELSIPIVVKEANVEEIRRFTLTEAEFTKHFREQLKELGTKLQTPLDLNAPEMAPVRAQVAKLYDDLDKANPEDDDTPDVLDDVTTRIRPIVRVRSKLIDTRYAPIFSAVLQAAKPGTTDLYKRTFPRNEFALEAQKALRDLTERSYVVTGRKLKELLVNPETGVIKTEATALSVFQIKARITEEGVSVSTLKDGSGTETTVVEFE
jgi:hypothetical protein